MSEHEYSKGIYDENKYTKVSEKIIKCDSCGNDVTVYLDLVEKEPRKYKANKEGFYNKGDCVKKNGELVFDHIFFERFRSKICDECAGKLQIERQEKAAEEWEKDKAESFFSEFSGKILVQGNVRTVKQHQNGFRVEGYDGVIFSFPVGRYKYKTGPSTIKDHGGI